MTKRKKYSKEFKLDAVSLELEQDYTRTEAAKSLGISPNMLGVNFQLMEPPVFGLMEPPKTVIFPLSEEVIISRF